MTITFPSTAGDFGSFSASSGTLIAVPVPTNVQDNDVLLCLVYHQIAGVVITPPAGWTQIYKTVASGTRGFALYYHKVVSRTTELAQATYTWTGNSGGRLIGKIFRVLGLASAVIDAVPASDFMSAGTGTTIPDPSVTAVGSDAVVLACNFTNCSTLIYPLASSPGFTKLFDDSATASPSTSTMSLLYKQLSAAGATGPVTVTLDQTAVTCGGFLVTLSTAVVAPPPAQTPVKTWAAAVPAYTAHRNGFYATYGEFTVAGFQACANWNSKVAWNIDVFKTSDNEWVASHDQTTGRVLSGASLDIPTSLWSAISGKTTLVGGYPVTRIDDIVAVAPPGTIFFVDNKANANQAAFFAKLTALGLSPSNTVIKNYVGSNANNTAARTAGYQVWQYGFDADTATFATNMISPDWLGFDYGGLQANWNTLIAQGRPSFAHILPDLAAKTTADTKAAAAGGSNFGYMVSNVAAVVPKFFSGLSGSDLKYTWMKAHSPAAAVTATVNDLEVGHLKQLGYAGTLADMRAQKWPNGEFAFMKAAVGTVVTQTLDDLRNLYYAGP